jgi:hypothetical protein
MSEWVPADPFSIAGTCDDQDHTLPALEEDLARICGMNAIAERDNLVVYPEQTTEATCGSPKLDRPVELVRPPHFRKRYSSLL